MRVNWLIGSWTRQWFQSFNQTLLTRKNREQRVCRAVWVYLSGNSSFCPGHFHTELLPSHICCQSRNRLPWEHTWWKDHYLHANGWFGPNIPAGILTRTGSTTDQSIQAQRMQIQNQCSDHHSPRFPKQTLQRFLYGEQQRTGENPNSSSNC